MAEKQWPDAGVFVRQTMWDIQLFHVVANAYTAGGASFWRDAVRADPATASSRGKPQTRSNIRAES